MTTAETNSPSIPSTLFQYSSATAEKRRWKASVRVPTVVRFHGDKSPSATVNAAEGWFRCHAFDDCPAGNAIQIVMKKEGVPYREAVEIAESIAREYGTEVSSTRSSRRSGRSRGGRSGGARVRRTWS